MRKHAVRILDTFAKSCVKIFSILPTDLFRRPYQYSKLKSDQFIILNVQDQSYTGYLEHLELDHLASMNKLLVARALLEEVINGRVDMNASVTIDNVNNHIWDRAGSNIGSNLELMLRHSSNTATNVLIEHLGGVDNVTYILKSIGYTSSAINCYTEPSSYVPSPALYKNQSTPYELARCMLEILQYQDYRFINPLKDTIYQFTHTNRVCNKVGINSTVIANVAVIEVKNVQYVVVCFYKLSRFKIKVYTILSELLALQKSPNLLLKWDPVSYFTQQVVKYLEG